MPPGLAQERGHPREGRQRVGPPADDAGRARERGLPSVGVAPQPEQWRVRTVRPAAGPRVRRTAPLASRRRCQGKSWSKMGAGRTEIIATAMVRADLRREAPPARPPGPDRLTGRRSGVPLAGHAIEPQQHEHAAHGRQEEPALRVLLTSTRCPVRAPVTMSPPITRSRIPRMVTCLLTAGRRTGSRCRHALSMSQATTPSPPCRPCIYRPGVTPEVGPRVAHTPARFP